ncbi:MAG: hypothetical protein SPJ34_06925 [Candidatus Ornithospirochaeta sp.]|nr:hypothetical protein [Candidatus Ornithospirochaeta sp.]
MTDARRGGKGYEILGPRALMIWRLWRFQCWETVKAEEPQYRILSEVLGQEQIELIESIRYSPKLISDELYSNPHFDGNSLAISISNAFSLDTEGLLSGIVLGEGDDIINFDELISKESLTNLKEALSVATRYAGKSSKSQTSNDLNLSKSSMTISESISENGNEIKSWKEIYGKIPMKASNPIGFSRIQFLIALRQI